MAPTSHLSLLPRTGPTTNDAPGLTSVFALIVYESGRLSSRSLSSLDHNHEIIHLKRQQAILVIPTTYATINSSPAPGTVAGIVIGTVLGFILVLFLVLYILRIRFGGRETIIEEEIIRQHHRSSSSSTSAPQVSIVNDPIPVVSRRTSRHESTHISRRSSRRPSARPPPEDTVIVEEELSEQQDEVIVEEEESDDDVVEVIEEHSPTPPPRRSSTRVSRSGFRTVDPSQPGGGDAPLRKISRRESRRD